MTPQAWRIYHNDAVNKTELTSSPTRVKKAREAGLTVVELVEKSDNTELLELLNLPVFSFESMQKRWMETK